MSVQSLDRAFDILELLSEETKGLTLTEIGRRLDLHKSTVHRLLSSLRERGYIEKAEDNGIYRLGLEFIALSSSYLNSLELKTEASPFMHTLSHQTGQTVFLAIRDGLDIVYLDKVETYSSLRRYQIIGQRKPLHCTSLGKSLLSGLPDERIAWLYMDYGFTALTENTITALPRLMDAVRTVRSRGWSTDDEEAEPGTKCVGAPIFDYRDKVIAALSLAWDCTASPELTFDIMAPSLAKAAQGISVRMGHRRDGFPYMGG